MTEKDKLTKTAHGFVGTIGHYRNDKGWRVPRKFRLGHDRQLARRKVGRLLEAWERLPVDRGVKD